MVEVLLNINRSSVIAVAYSVSCLYEGRNDFSKLLKGLSISGTVPFCFGLVGKCEKGTLI